MAKLEQASHDQAQDAERALVFQAVGGLVQFLQGQLGVLEHGIVVDQLAHRPLAAVHLLQDLAHVGHGLGRLGIERLVLGQLAQRAFAAVDLVDHTANLSDHPVGLTGETLDVAGGDLEVGDGAVGGVVERVVHDQPAHRAVALGDGVGDGLHVADDGGEGGAVLLDEVGERAEQGAEAFGAETFGEVFDAAGHSFQLDHERAEVGLFEGFDGAEVDGGGVGGTAFDADEGP